MRLRRHGVNFKQGMAVAALRACSVVLPTERTETAMNKDQVKGSLKDMIGKAQRKLGKATGSASEQIRGAGKQVAGKLQKSAGDVREANNRTK